MSSTRHAAPDAPLSQNRYMSSPEYAELRGLCGTAVAAKAALLSDPRKRSLLFFLQALSLQPGGLRKASADLLASMADHLGSPTMHALGMKPGQVYAADQVRPIRQELGLAPGELPLHGEGIGRHPDKQPGLQRHWEVEDAATGALRQVENPEYRRALADYQEACRRAAKHPRSYPAAVLLAKCRELAACGLEPFLVELCINPKVLIRLPDAPEDDCQPERVAISEQCAGAGAGAWNLQPAALGCFKDAIGALLEYQRRHAQAARAGFVETEISRQVFSTLEAGLESRKIVILEGPEGIGKTKAAEVWCQMRLGQARFIRLEGVTNRTLLFRAICKACGLASTYTVTATEMQARIRDYLERTGMMLVIDEAHRLFPQSDRIYSHPEMLNWIYTLYDIRIPVALVATPQFRTRMFAVEQQTDWRSGQLRRRTRRYQKLPEKLQDRELLAIAQQTITEADAEAIREIADLAANTPFQLDAMQNLAEDARLVAQNHGRQRITLKDVEQAQAQYWNASTQAIVPPPAAPHRGRKPARSGRRLGASKRFAEPMQDDFTGHAEADQEAPLPPAPDTFPDRRSGHIPQAEQARPSRLTGHLVGT